jgi:hypothetical protein
MAKKTLVKKVNKKKTRAIISLTQLIFIIVAVLIALAFLFFNIYLPKSNKMNPGQSLTGSNSVPEFRKDGSLTIILAKDSSPINLDIEIADDEEERMRGLMDRVILPDNAGMFFIFPNDAPRSFWMKNTFISLDIIYINSMKEIVSIQKYTQPKTTYSIPSEKPAMYVLEVNAGFTDKYGINPGDKIALSN